jgi:hypothetical protein
MNRRFMDSVFLLKFELQYRPLIVIAAVIIFFVVYFGFVLRSLERSYDGDDGSTLDFEYLTNGWWLAIVSITTVGYGDGYPSTHIGRFCGLLIGVGGTLLISICVIVFQRACMFNPK